MRGFVTSRWWPAAGLLAVLAGTALRPALPVAGAQDPAPPAPPKLAPLPAAPAVDPAQAALGRDLFFDVRLSGDATVSCATCHQPDHAFADGLAMAKGYPGALYFRNTPTLLNATLGRWFYWDGRLEAKAPSRVVADHVREAHFLHSDVRFVVEKLRQVPEYEAAFTQAFGHGPTETDLYTAVAAYLQTLRSHDVPFDRFLAGDATALSAAAQRGLAAFRGPARCITCHNGPLLSDQDFHAIGLPPDTRIADDPLRHITLRRFLRIQKVPGARSARTDPGRAAATHRAPDTGTFRTPSLREVARTAPYLHDGRAATLAEAIAAHATLRPTAPQVADLVAFLESLSGAAPTVKPPTPPEYRLRPLEGK